MCCGSFSDRRLARLRRLVGPRLCTSLGPAGTARLRAASYGVPTGRAPGAVRAGAAPLPRPRAHRRRASSRTAHRLGLQVHVWTVDDEAEMDELLDLGVDGIMTDRPTLLRDVLVRRGAWAGRPGT